MRILLGCAAATLILAGTAHADPPLTPQQQAQIAKLRDIYRNLHPQFGDVRLPGINVTLHLGKEYYYVAPDEARRILVDAWHNSPEAVSEEKGLVFPTGKTFVQDTWSAVVSYTGQGYVSDSDAHNVDYNGLLQQVRDGEDEINARRKLEHLAPLHLVGWAQPPSYDATHHSLVWAREIQLGNEPDHLLNYDLRVLGRRGVLSMNILSIMSRIGEARTVAARLRNVGTFDAGARYSDYKPGVDKSAGYGIAGLVAAGVGVVLAKKLGLIAVGLIFIKKFIAIILAGFAGVGAWLRRLFRMKAKQVAPAPTPGQFTGSG